MSAPTTCVALGHGNVPATVIGTLLTDGEVTWPDVAYCTDCADSMIATGDFMPTRYLTGSIWNEVQAERERAHAKHGATSMESLAVDDLTRLTVLVEEVGEVARVFNEGRHSPPADHLALREELIQVAAMAGAWADALPQRIASTVPDHLPDNDESRGHEPVT